MTNTPRNNQKQSDMDGDRALIEMQHIIRELEELESLLHSTDTDAAESTHSPPDHTNPCFAFEKRISELIDHIAWENESHLGLYSLVDHRDTRLTCIRIVSELNPDRKRANWSTLDYVPSGYKQYKYSIDLKKEVSSDLLFDVFSKKLINIFLGLTFPFFHPVRSTAFISSM